MKIADMISTYEAKSREAQELLERGNEMTADDLAKAQALLGECEAMEPQIKEAQSIDALKARNAERLAHLSTPVLPAPHVTGQPGGTVVVGSTKSGETHFEGETITSSGEGLIDPALAATIGTKSYGDAFRSYLRGGINGVTGAEMKALQEGVDTAGGFTVPQDFLQKLIEKKPAPTRVGGLLSRFQTSRDKLTIPKVTYTTDDLYTTGIRVTVTGEVPASSTVHRVTEPTFGQLTIPVYTVMMSLPLTNDLIEDSAFPLMSWAAGKFRETVDLWIDNMALNGTGINQPAGILRNPNGTDEPATVASGSASALTADGLIDLEFAVPEQYDEGAVWVFNKANAGRAISKLKDGAGHYLWAQGVGDSGLANTTRGRMLRGSPVVFSAFMPDASAGTYPVVYGDPKGYYLVERIGFSVQVLRELYAENNQVVLLGRFRVGGAVAEPWRMKIQVVSA